LQGLFALNSPFIQHQAEALGARLAPAPGQTTPRRIALAYSRLYQRPPTPSELAASQRFLLGREADPSAWVQYAHALLVGNEMLFLD